MFSIQQAGGIVKPPGLPFPGKYRRVLGRGSQFRGRAIRIEYDGAAQDA